MNLSRIRQNVIIEGRPGLTLARGALWAAHCVLHRPAIVRIGSDGPRMKLAPRLRTFGATSLYMKRDGYEPSLRIFTGLARAGDVVLDVGANYGVYALLTAVAVGPEGMVHCFEPGSASLLQLRQNIALNPGLPISVHEFALSNSLGSGSLFHVGGSPTTFSLGEDSRVGRETVTKTTLDTWASDLGIRRVRAIKMDVEGHEARVIQGGATLIRATRPVIMFEVSHAALRRNGSTAEELWALVTSFGYNILGLRHARLVPLDGPHEGNLFAFPSDFDARALPIELATKLGPARA
jgi:FkbM family methyltransferase